MEYKIIGERPPENKLNVEIIEHVLLENAISIEKAREFGLIFKLSQDLKIVELYEVDKSISVNSDGEYKSTKLYNVFYNRKKLFWTLYEILPKIVEHLAGDNTEEKILKISAELFVNLNEYFAIHISKEDVDIYFYLSEKGKLSQDTAFDLILKSGKCGSRNAFNETIERLRKLKAIEIVNDEILPLETINYSPTY
jgi:hypothetical protein